MWGPTLATIYSSDLKNCHSLILSENRYAGLSGHGKLTSALWNRIAFWRQDVRLTVVSWIRIADLLVEQRELVASL